MISVNEALNKIEEHTEALSPVKVPLLDAAGAVLAEDLYAPINMPPFRNSAMDGYAIIYGNNNTYQLIDELKAGDAKDIQLRQGEAIRVFTGATLPENADTVVIQERVTETGSEIEIDQFPSKYANIRDAGEQVKEGELVLEKGTKINEAAIGFLAGLGIEKIQVYRTPKVAILITGNELQKPGERLRPGCIYESNSIMLKAALKRKGIKEIEILTAKDKLEETREKINSAFQKSDMLLVSGGISVGDYDFVKQALDDNGAEEVFYKVNQKPGKPLWYGKKEDKSIFALPGNPASSLSCFYVYVLPALYKMMGYKDCRRQRQNAKTTSEIKNTSDKMLFLKAVVENNKIEILNSQSSSMLNTFAFSNALACIPEAVGTIAENDEIEYINLDF